MSGGGVGGILKMAAPLALSVAFPGFGSALAAPLMEAGMGATTAGLVSSGLMNGLLSGGLGAIGGSKNPLQDALMGGAVGAAGTYFGGGAKPDVPLDAAKDVTVNVPSASPSAGGAAVNAGGGMPLVDRLGVTGGYADPAIAQTGSAVAAPPMAPVASPSFLSRAGDYISANPVQSGIIGLTGLSALDSLTNRRADPTPVPNGYNDKLPAYEAQNTATPYTGDWYKYGFMPQQPMVDSQIRRTGYAKGGAIKNPLARAEGSIPGKGMGGHADDVPIMASEGEFMLPADVVSHLGDGSSKAGGKKLDQMVKKVRKHKATKGFPPKARNPLSYIGGA